MIKIENLKKTFVTPRGTVTVFENLNTEIPDGSFIGLKGKSGAGKSTLLSILAGLQKPAAGRILITAAGIETDIFSLDDSKLCAFRNKNIGFISQEQSFLDNLSVIDNVRLPAFIGGEKLKKQQTAEITERALSLLEKLGIAHLAASNPATLSGGENHRVLIARALINNPEIILADEPTDSVDSENTEAIIKIFRTLADEGKTVILVSHDKEALKLCDNEINL